LRQKVHVQILTEKLSSEAVVVEAIKNSRVIIPVRERTKFTASLLKALPNLEYISQTGNHVYHIDMEAATKQGIVVSLAPGGNSTTELAFGLMLAVMRKIPQSDRALRRGEWPLARCVAELALYVQKSFDAATLERVAASGKRAIEAVQA